MKKIFTLVAASMMAAGAFAQTESAFIDTENTFNSSDAVAINADTKLCESANVVMYQAWDDTYKKVAMTGEADLVKAVSIDGVEYAMPAGIQCQTNPKENNLTSFGQVSGAVFKFEVKADGILYVFGKMTYNKNYYVWEGNVGLDAMPVAYTFAAGQVKDGQGDATVGYTLPGDELGYYVMGNGYDDGTKYLNAAQCVEVAAGGDPATLTHWTAGNGLGVIAFPVYKDAQFYYVNACGSKVTSNGFVFVPGATQVGTIAFTEGGTTGIQNVESTAAQSVRKVATANGIQIVKAGKTYNVAGQEL